MHVVAGTAVGRPSLRHCGDQLAVGARSELFGLLRMTSSTQLGHLVRSRYSVRFRGSCSGDMPGARAMTGRAVEPGVGMPMRVEVLAHGRVASDARRPDRLLGGADTGQQKRRNYKPHCGFLTMPLSIDAKSFLPANATASRISAASNS